MTFVHPTNCIFQSYLEFTEALSLVLLTPKMTQEQVKACFIRKEAEEYRDSWNGADWTYVIEHGLKPLDLQEAYERFIDELDACTDSTTAEQKEMFHFFCENYG